MNRCVRRLIVAVCAAAIVLAISPYAPGQRIATPPPSATPSHVPPPPEPSRTPKPRPTGPNAGQIIEGLLHMGAEAARHQAEMEQARPARPRPTPWPHAMPPPEPVWPRPLPGVGGPIPHPIYKPIPNAIYEPIPNAIYEPIPNRIDQPPPSRADSPPQPNVVEMPAEVAENRDFSLSAQPVTPLMLSVWKNETKRQQEKAVSQIRRLIPEHAGDALVKLDELAVKAGEGTLTSDDLHALAAMMKSSLPRSMAGAANHLFHRLAVLSRMAALLRTAVPGGGPVPFGNQVPIILVPALPRGTIYVLGNGAVVIGVGGLCRFVDVGRGNVAQCVGMTVGIGSPVGDSTSKPLSGGALLINSEELPVHYNVNEHRFTMEPDFSQTLPGGRVWVVAFDRGGSFGRARYTVSEGTYKFTLTEKGWDLFKVTFDVTIDNAENPFEFLYLVNHFEQGLASGEAKRHTHIYPMIVRFDNGRRETKTRKLEHGVYKVAVTLQNTLDLFPADAVAAPAIPEPAPGPAVSPGEPAAPGATSVVAPSAPPPTTTSVALATPVSPSTSVPPSTSVSPSAMAPPPGLAESSPTGEDWGKSLFGDQGDWRPSLFVSDVPEIAYFDPGELPDVPGADPSVPLPFGKPG